MPADPESPPQGQGPRPPHRGNHCKLCDAPFININGMSSTTCDCARTRPDELAAAQKRWDESQPLSHPQGPRPALAALAAELEALGAKAMKAPWGAEPVTNDGLYGDGPNPRQGFDSYQLTAGGEVIADTLNSDAIVVNDDEDGAYDEVGRANVTLIVTLRNALPEILTALRAGLAAPEEPHDWVRCPICKEPGMRREFHDGGNLIHCVNHACPSNNPDAGLAARGDGTPPGQQEPK